MRRLIPCVLACVLVMVGVVGCGNDRSGSHIPKTDAEPTTQPTFQGTGGALNPGADKK
ncbi:MAG TPA: hypothetical protein VKE40_25335 [Gemmataceae bacterium]|nr:hypothetical protein [Gemmataceae bacterium]